MTKQSFAAMILGGTGQVGGAVVEELLAIPECREVVMVTRKRPSAFGNQHSAKPTTKSQTGERQRQDAIAARSRVRNVILDTGAADFADRTAALAREMRDVCAAAHPSATLTPRANPISWGPRTADGTDCPVSAVSCVGVGSGSGRWSEEELKRLELGVVGAFARGCHDAGIAQFCLLSAAGSSARSRFRYARVMGMKEDTVRSVGFTRLAIFRPGIIAGNAHTPAWMGWLGRLVPGPWGSIDQRTLARSIAAEIALHGRESGEVIRENAAMKKLAEKQPR